MQCPLNLQIWIGWLSGTWHTEGKTPHLKINKAGSLTELRVKCALFLSWSSWAGLVSSARSGWPAGADAHSALAIPGPAIIVLVGSNITQCGRSRLFASLSLPICGQWSAVRLGVSVLLTRALVVKNFILYLNQ